MIIAATRGQHYLGDNGLWHGFIRLPHGRPSGPGAGTDAEYAIQGHVEATRGSTGSSCLHVDGSLWCAQHH